MKIGFILSIFAVYKLLIPKIEIEKPFYTAVV